MATPVGVGRALCTALSPGSTGIRTAPPVPPVLPQTEASALIVPAAADPVRRRGAGARPDGVFSGAPWHRPARPPGVIAPHNGTVERQRKAMSVSVNAVDDPSHEHAVPIIPEVVNFLDCAAMRHRQAQGSGQVPEQALRRSRMAARLSITAAWVVLRTCGTTGWNAGLAGSGSSAVRRRAGRRPRTTRSPCICRWAVSPT